MGTGGAQKGASTRAVFYFSYPLPMFNPCYEVNWEAQALEAAQSAANPALPKGSTRLLHDIVLGTVTSHEVQRRRRRHHDVTIGKFTGRRRRRRRRDHDVTNGKFTGRRRPRRRDPDVAHGKFTGRCRRRRRRRCCRSGCRCRCFCRIAVVKLSLPSPFPLSSSVSVARSYLRGPTANGDSHVRRRWRRRQLTRPGALVRARTRSFPVRSLLK
jgi:hypothetical protein